MRLSDDRIELAQEIVARYPRPRSALIPLLHLAQEQNGYLTDDAMRHVGELVDAAPAEVKGTAGFYEMFRFEPVGTYMVNICTNISCLISGGAELLEHASKTLGTRPGGTTADGKFTLEEVECIAACTEAPCLQVNYRYYHRMGTADFDHLIDDLRSGDLDDVIPPHGVLAQVRQSIPPDRRAGIVAPEHASEAPVWIGTANGAGQ